MFILLIPQINSAINKSRISGVQIDLNDFRNGIKSYFMEETQNKSLTVLNSYLDKDLQFEQKNNTFISSKKNPFGNNYILTTDWQFFMKVSSYDKKNKEHLNICVVSDELDDSNSYCLEDNTNDLVDTEGPVITFSKNGSSEFVSYIDLNVIDNISGVDYVEYVWSDSTTKPDSGWERTSSSTSLNVKLGNTNLYNPNTYLHVQSADKKGNISYKVSDSFSLGTFSYTNVTGGVSITGYNNNLIKELALPEYIDGKKVVSVSTNAFSGKGFSLETISIPDSVESINPGSFYWTEAKKVYIGKGLKTIEKYPFGDELTFEISKDNPYIKTDENGGAIYSADGKELIVGGSSLAFDTELFKNITTIRAYAYHGVSSIKGNITFPSSLTNIGDYAFAYCDILKATFLNPRTSYASYTFYQNYNLEIIK